MIELCLFDLDDTLMHTRDLEEIRPKGVRISNGIERTKYKSDILTTLNLDKQRIIYDEQFLFDLKRKFNQIKLGVFTRAPKLYAETVLNWAYPNFRWDTITAYEDVAKTKPDGEGIIKAMRDVKITDVKKVVLIGDELNDVQAAYNSGCLSIIDRHAWRNTKKSSWKSLDHVPDAIVSNTNKIHDVLASSSDFLPELERLLDQKNKIKENLSPRFVEIGYFDELPAKPGRAPFKISVAGRYFSKHATVEERREWHALTHSIDKSKESSTFPKYWAESIRSFIGLKFSSFVKKSIEICVIPHRYDAEPRLEKLLVELEDLITRKPLLNLKIGFHSELLAYKEGSRSHHKNFLDKAERFKNVRDHLFVNQNKIFNNNSPSILVIDDVVTTGASLIYAEKYLKEAGASNVVLFSIAKNIGKNYDTDLT